MTGLLPGEETGPDLRGCANCQSHRGDVFPGEGFETPTDLWHRVNSVSLRLVPDEGLNALSLPGPPSSGLGLRILNYRDRILGCSACVAGAAGGYCFCRGVGCCLFYLCQ